MLVRFGLQLNIEKVELMIFTQHMKRWLCRRTCNRKLFNIWHKTKVVDSFLEWHSVSWATWCEWLLFWPHFSPTAASKNRRPTFWRMKKQDWSDVSYRHYCFPSIQKYADFPTSRSEQRTMCHALQWLIYLSIYPSIHLSIYLSIYASIRALLFCLCRFEFVFCCTSGGG